VDAQRSRGLEVDRGPVMKRARRYCLVLVPLFIRILGTAQNITMSMFIYRLHLGSSRSSLKEIRTKRDDLLFLGISILVFAGAGISVINSLKISGGSCQSWKRLNLEIQY
jgi:energy-coupling factor transport system permease protein